MWRPAVIATLALSLFGGASWTEAWNWWRGEDAYHQEQYQESAEAFAEGQTGTAGKIQSTLAYNEGNARFAQQDFPGAEEAFDRAAKANPEHWEALYNKGNAQTWQGYDGERVTNPEKLREAIKTYEEALKVKPEEPDVTHNLEFVKKLLEEQEQQQNQDQNEQQDQQEQQSKDQQDQNQDQQSGDQQESEQQNEEQGDQDKDQSGSGDKQEQDKGEQDKEQQSGSQGDQQQEEQQGNQQQQQQQQGQREQSREFRQSQRMLDQLAELEQHLQHNRSLSRDPQLQDPWQQMTDPLRSIFGMGGTGSEEDDSDVDW